MADNHINISIGSSFNAEGFNKLTHAAGEVTKTTGKIVNGVSQIGGALGQFDGTIGKVTNAAGGLMSAFSMAGPLGLAIAGISALAGWLGKMKKEAEEAKKRIDEMNAAAEKARIERVFNDAKNAIDKASGSLGDYIKKLNAVAEAVERRVKAENALAEAQSRVDKSAGNVTLAEMRNAGERGLNGLEGGELNLEQAKQALEQLKEQNRQTLKALDDAAKQAVKDLKDANEAVGRFKEAHEGVGKEIEQMKFNYDKQMDAATQEVKRLGDRATQKLKSWIAVEDKTSEEAVKAREEYTNAMKEYTKGQEELSNIRRKGAQEIEKAEEQQAKMSNQITEAMNKVAIAEKGVEEANNNLKAARLDADTSERKTTRSINDLDEAIKKEQKAREDAIDRMEKEQKARKDAIEAEEDAVQMFKDAQGPVIFEMDRLKEAISDAETAMRNAAAGVQWANQNNWGGFSNQGYNPNDFNQFRRANRFNDRANRDAKSRNPTEKMKQSWEAREEELAKRLGKNKKDWDNMTDQEFEDALNSREGRRLSNSQKQWLRDKRNWDNQQNKDKNANRMKELEEEKNRNIARLAADTQKIKEDLAYNLKKLREGETVN